MSAFALTAANVKPSAKATLIYGTFGETMTAGQPFYRDAADLDLSGRPKFKLADNNASAVTAKMEGVTVCGGSAGQAATGANADPLFTHGLAGVVAGDIIVLAAAAGALAPAADLASGNYPVVAMVAIDATTAVLSITRGTTAKV